RHPEGQHLPTLLLLSGRSQIAAKPLGVHSGTLGQAKAMAPAEAGLRWCELTSARPRVRADAPRLIRCDTSAMIASHKLHPEAAQTQPHRAEEALWLSWFTISRSTT